MENSFKERIWELISRKMADEASAAELSELQLLLQQHPEEAFSFEILQDFWKVPVPEDKQYAEQQYRAFTRKMHQMGIDTIGFHEEEGHLINTRPRPLSHWRVSGKKILFTGFSVFILLFIGVLFYVNMPRDKEIASVAKSKKSEITTKYGSKTNIVLPDGSKVCVNAGSKLSYDNNYGASLREVYLEGEAFFDVAHNPEKPFIIHTAKMDIKDLGTAFNVRCYPDEKKAETSLIRGSIEITLKDRPTEKIYLKPNEKLTLLNEELITSKKSAYPSRKEEAIIPEPLVAIGHVSFLQKDKSVIETSWVDNKLVFRGETFEEVALKMERWYGVNIIISGDNLKQVHLTGAFEGETVEQALSALQLTTPFKYTNNRNTILITK